MTSKLVVNTIEADTGISSVSFASSISMDSTSKFHFSAAGVDIGADTNINRPAAGKLAFNINSSEKVRITSDGFLGISTASVLAPFHAFNATNNTIARLESGDATCRLQLVDSAGMGFVAVSGDNLILANTSSITERLRIDSSGRFLLNMSTSVTGGKFQANNQFNTFFAATNDATGCILQLEKTRSTSPGSYTIVQDGDKLGELQFKGSNGSASVIGASLQAIVNGTPGSGNDLPTDLAFRTMPDGVGSTVERLRITSSGQMGLGVSSLQANAKLQVNGNIGAAQFYTTTTSAPQTDFNSDVATNKAGLLLRRSSETNGDYSGLEFHNHPSSNTLYRKGGIYFQSDGSGFGRGDMVFVNDGAGDSANLAISDEKMRIHKEGHVTKPYHVCFGATGNQGTYSVATGQVFAFNAYHQSYPNSRHTAYNTSTSKFTAPVAGVYSFTVNLYFRNVNLSNLFSLVPRINGSEVTGGAGDKMFFFSCQNINGDTTISGTVYLNLGAGDEVDVARRTGQAGSHSFYMPHSSFFGHLIG